MTRKHSRRDSTGWPRHRRDGEGCVKYGRSLLLLLDTDGGTLATSGLGVLTSALESPEVPETSMELHLGHALHVLTELGLQNVRRHLEVLAFLIVALPVEEPTGDASSLGISDHVSDLLSLLLGELVCLSLWVPARMRGLILRILQMR